MHGHKKDSMHTYGMISGMIICGMSLGSTTGPIIGGAITDALDFTWVGTILAGVNSTMVSYLNKFINWNS